MPIIKAAIKALRQSEKRRKVNRTSKDQLKAGIKDFIKLVEAKKMSEAQTKLPEVTKLIDKAYKNNLIHGNNAARKKSRLARLVAAK